MKNHERINAITHALQKEGYECHLFIEIISRTTVPSMPMHWAHGLPILVGTLKFEGEGIVLERKGPKRFKLQLDKCDESSPRQIVEMLENHPVI